MRRGIIVSLGSIITLGAITAAAACSESTPPQQALTGRYELLSVNGASLPIVVFSGLDGSTLTLIEGAIEFRSRGRLVDVRTFQSQSPAGGTGQPQADSSAFTYDLAGDTLLVRHPQLFEADSYVDTGTVTGQMLTIIARPRVSQLPDGSARVGGEMRYARSP